MSKPLRILMVSHAPWDRELGAGAAQIGLAGALEDHGASVVKFDCRDAFGDERPARWHRFFPLRFAARAREYVREHGHRFDVIEGLHGDLPFTKRELGFEGLLVARSVGLYALYAEFDRLQHRAWPERIPGTRPGKALRRWSDRRILAACRRSLDSADLVKLLNDDELEYAQRVLGLGPKCVVLPEGLADTVAEEFARSRLSAADRLRRREVAVIGSWCLRKGSADWPEIVARTRSLVPDATFRFLGTRRERNEVLTDLGLPDVDWVSVVPQFEAAVLPSLLAGATVGALPSYVEGFGLGVLEQLAAGIPTVTYDVPGPRVMLRRLTTSLLASRGDTSRFSELLAKLLTLDPPSYRQLADECVSVANEFRWSWIARASLDAYDDAAANPAAAGRRFRDGTPGPDVPLRSPLVVRNRPE